MEERNFKEWAIVELFGRTQLAGVVTSQVIGNCSFVRVDVPEQDGQQACTKLYGEKAIYAITPVTEEIARRFLSNCRPEPVERWCLRERAPAPAIPDQSEAGDLVDMFDAQEEAADAHGDGY